MRVFRAVAMIALLAGLPGSAHAQAEKRMPQYGDQKGKSQEEIDEEKRADKAYEKSLGNIPEKPPADPWGNARSADTAKPAAKTAVKAAPTKPKIKTGSTAN
jgi:hypothetical protein